MNDMISSAPWPNFNCSRQNKSDQFNFSPISVWQQNTETVDFLSPDDYDNVWSAKSISNEDNGKESLIKSIWNTNSSDGVCGVDVVSPGSDVQKPVDETPTNSPSLKRTEIINCTERWGSTKISQLTPWNVVDIDIAESQTHDPMVWRAKVDGTEVWEEYYVRQHGRRRPQADDSFNCESVWSCASEVPQSTNSVWPPKNDVSSPSSDIYSPNIIGDVNIRSHFGALNGVRPSMTRIQAQKYLIDMGYSLSDAIGALVNNQMDLQKAINELQSKYRMSTNGSTVPTGMFTPTPSFNNRSVDNVNMTRFPPGAAQINHMVGHNSSNVPPMMGSNFANNFEMFHTDPSEWSPESQYMSMEPAMSQFGRAPEAKRLGSLPLTRDLTYRSSFPGNNVVNGRAMAGNCGQFPDMSSLSQGMNRMSMNPGQGGLPPQAGPFSSKWPAGPNSYSGLQNGGHSPINMMLNGAGPMDMRQNFAPPMGPGLGRSMSKQPMYARNPSYMGWPSDGSPMPPHGALADLSQVRLAKNLSCPGAPENIVGIVVKKIQLHHVDLVKAICMDSGAMTNIQLQPHSQSIVIHFNCALEARRCMGVIQSQINCRVEFLNEDSMYPLGPGGI